MGDVINWDPKQDPTFDRRLGRPAADRVRLLVREMYELKGHGAGGCMHIVTDDENLERDSIEFCLDVARKRGCAPCIRLASLLLLMTATQVKKAVRR